MFVIMSSFWLLEKSTEINSEKLSKTTSSTLYRSGLHELAR